MLAGFNAPGWLDDSLTWSGFWRPFLARVILVFLVMALTFALSRFARQRFRNGLERSGLQLNVALLLARLLWITVWAIGVIAVLSVIGVGLTPLAAFIGVVGLAASLALQQVLQNLVAGVYLLGEQPFHIGDLIAVVGPSGANHEGTVEDIQVRTTHLRNRQGELVLMPNSALFSGVVTNRTAVGGSVSHVTLTCPRSIEPESVQARVVPLLQNLAGVLREPEPELQMQKVEADSWTAQLVFWVSRKTYGGAVWAIASAIPEATVSADTETA